MSDLLERLDTFDVATSTVGTTEALLDDCQEEIQRLQDTIEEQRRTIVNLVEPAEKATGKQGTTALLTYIARLEQEQEDE